MVFNTTFNKFQCESELLVEENGVHRENHGPATSHWQTLSHNSVSPGTAGNRHKQNSWFCKEIREDNFRYCWRRVHEDASQGMYMSKIENFFLLLEYCKIRECYAVANAFTIRNMYSLFLYMKCNSRKINRPTQNMTDEKRDTLTFLSCS